MANVSPLRGDGINYTILLRYFVPTGLHIWLLLLYSPVGTKYVNHYDLSLKTSPRGGETLRNKDYPTTNFCTAAPFSVSTRNR